MAQAREAMIAELKRVAVPVLRSLGFKGSFPHFRREMDTQIDLLSFQFSMSGGQFVVEIGKFPAKGYRVFSELIPPGKVMMRHLERRLRLGAKGMNDDHWFNYDAGNYQEVAESVIPYIRRQAVRWWSRRIR